MDSEHCVRWLIVYPNIGLGPCFLPSGLSGTLRRLYISAQSDLLLSSFSSSFFTNYHIASSAMETWVVEVHWAFFYSSIFVRCLWPFLATRFYSFLKSGTHTKQPPIESPILIEQHHGFSRRIATTWDYRFAIYLRQRLYIMSTTDSVEGDFFNFYVDLGLRTNCFMKGAARLHEFIIKVYHPDPQHASKINLHLHVKWGTLIYIYI